MPCMDGGPSHEQLETERNIPRALCAILGALEHKNALRDTIERADWDEAGVSPQWLLAWWEAHKETDRRRREYERKQREREAERQAVLSKLTPEERRALNLR